MVFYNANNDFWKIYVLIISHFIFAYIYIYMQT
jgi:hypothetical protein